MHANGQTAVALCAVRWPELDATASAHWALVRCSIAADNRFLHPSIQPQPLEPLASLAIALLSTSLARALFSMKRAATLSRQMRALQPRIAACSPLQTVAPALAFTSSSSSSHILRSSSIHTRATLAAPAASTPLQSPAAAAAPAAPAAEVASYPQLVQEAEEDDAPGFQKSIARTWHLFDARDQVVGRMAGRIATLLIGKNKPSYTPWIDQGDAVVVLNAKYLKFTGETGRRANSSQSMCAENSEGVPTALRFVPHTIRCSACFFFFPFDDFCAGNKWTQKLYRYHTGYPGGLKEIPAERWRTSHPDRILRHAVAGMIRKNKLKIPRLDRLKIYPGVLHPHQAQFPFDMVANVPQLKAQREEELRELKAKAQAEQDALNLAANGGAAKKVVPAPAAAAGDKKKPAAAAAANPAEDNTLPENPDIRTAILKDREQRKGKPSVPRHAMRTHAASLFLRALRWLDARTLGYSCLMLVVCLCCSAAAQYRYVVSAASTESRSSSSASRLLLRWLGCAAARTRVALWCINAHVTLITYRSTHNYSLRFRSCSSRSSTRSQSQRALAHDHQHNEECDVISIYVSLCMTSCFDSTRE